MTETNGKKKDKKATVVMTPEFRVSFPAVFKPRSAAEGQKEKYSISMLFPKTTDLTPLKLAVRKAIEGKWGTDQAKWPKGLRLPFRDGNEKDYDGYKDTVFCTASSEQKPGLVDQNVEDIIDQGEFYGGCYARATINAFAYDKAGNKGVAFGLRNIQKIRDGAAFSGKTDPKDDFDAIKLEDAGDGAPAVDPLGGIGA